MLVDFMLLIQFIKRFEYGENFVKELAKPL